MIFVSILRIEGSVREGKKEKWEKGKLFYILNKARNKLKNTFPFFLFPFLPFYTKDYSIEIK